MTAGVRHRRQAKIHAERGGAVRVFAANERMNQMLIEHLDPDVWSAKPPGRVRTIAAIFTHMHNVRTKWIRLSAPQLKLPRQLNRAHATQEQTRRALAESAARCTEMLAEALDHVGGGEVWGGEVGGGEGRVVVFQRDGWARPWPAGVEMLGYMVAHEAHHRGQVCMLAHQMGFPLAKAVTARMWSWETLWKECGMAGASGAQSPRAD